MDSLHLSYREVVKEIPYRTLLLMTKDKQHSTDAEVWEEVDEDEFFKGKTDPRKKQGQ